MRLILSTSLALLAACGASTSSTTGFAGASGSTTGTHSSGSSGSTTGHGTTAAGGSGTTSSGVAATTASGAATSSSGGATTSSGGSGTVACAPGAMLTTLPACTTPDTASVDVHAGCIPSVDGVYTEGEWSDATCVTAAGDPLYLKYAGSTLYVAWSVTPVCGCGIVVAFNPDDATAFDGQQFAISVFDDPFSSSGDSSGYTDADGGWNGAPLLPGIVIANPPNQPSPVTYEWAIPLSALGVTPGQAHTFTLYIDHSDAMWPTALTPPSGGNELPDSITGWGQISSSSSWQ